MSLEHCDNSTTLEVGARCRDFHLKSLAILFSQLIRVAKPREQALAVTVRQHVLK